MINKYVRFFSRLFCAFGIHGPERCGNVSTKRSAYVVSFARECQVCGEKWKGAEVVIDNVRTVGGWSRIVPYQKKLESSVLDTHARR